MDMRLPPGTAPKPLVLPGQHGWLCGLYYAPAAGTVAAGDVLVVPAFAEEMNRCRAMVSLQARALAAQGIGTLVLDPSCTGDSGGEFVDATWRQWRDDLQLGIDWLQVHGQGCRALLGIRLGAILAAELAAANPGIGQLLFWQPVFNGKLFYTQFLRIRVAAELNLPNRIKTTGELREKSGQGEPIEVSGYEVGPRLAQELDALELPEAPLLSPRRSAWFEVVADAATTLSPASAKVVAALKDKGAAVQTDLVVGPPFWHVHERELAPALIEATTACLQSWPPLSVAGRTDASPPPPAADSPERPVLIDCDAHRLSGVLHRGSGQSARGAVIVVAGGPQYRAGAHRQFVSMARKIAGLGSAVLRFDLRGMGDSSGSYLGYEQSEPDLRAAVDAMVAAQPQVREVVLIGECESASGILFYAWRDPRVTGVVLVNPWVRTEEGQAQVIVKRYYLDRLRSPEFWSLVRNGKFDVRRSVASFVAVVRAYVRGRRMFSQADRSQAQDDISGLPLPVRTAVGLSRFKGQVLLLMSGHDYIAREFDEVTAASKAWQGLLTDPRVRRCDVEGADHTFSRKHWKNAASDAIVAWMKAW